MFSPVRRGRRECIMPRKKSTCLRRETWRRLEQLREDQREERGAGARMSSFGGLVSLIIVFLSEKYRKTTERSNQGSDIISFAITKSNSDFGQENGLEGCRGWVWRDGGGAVLWRGVNGWKRCLEGGTDLLVINGLWWDKKMEVSKVIFRFGLGHLGEW